MPSDYQAFIEIDRVLHAPARLVIVALLYEVENADFTFLVRETQLTKGNLSSHLDKLEGAGYVAIQKGYRGKIPQTTCSLTRNGRAAFRAYRDSLKRTMVRLPK
jgi:DNA-binding transcriptional ArsR family regulator